MQIGILHLKAVQSAEDRDVDETGPFSGRLLVEDMHHFDTSAEYFGQYLQEIDHPNVKASATIVDHPEDLLDNTTGPDGEPMKYFIKNSELNDKYKKWEEKLKLNNYHKSGYYDDDGEMEFITYYTLEKKRGIYYKRVAELQINVREELYDLLYENRDESIYTFTSKKVLSLIYENIDKVEPDVSREQVELDKFDFKKGVLFNYEEGASYVHVFIG